MEIADKVAIVTGAGYGIGRGIANRLAAAQASLSGLNAEQRAADNIPEPMLTPEDIGDAVVEIVRDGRLFGRVILYYEPGKKRSGSSRWISTFFL